MAEQFERVEGLQLWMPGDSFEQEHNRKALRDIGGKLQTITIMSDPESPDIYVGGDDSVIYETVRDEDVENRHAQLMGRGNQLTPSLASDFLFEGVDLKEEARAQELHRALGRTGMRLAIGAYGTLDFRRATQDIKSVMEMVNQPIHTLEQFNAIPEDKLGGLLYKVLQAARKHKIFTADRAAEFADAIGFTLLPDKHGRLWRNNAGQEFIKRISFPIDQIAPEVRRTMTEQEKEREGYAPSTVHFVRHDPPKKPARVRAVKTGEKAETTRLIEHRRTKADDFLDMLITDKTRGMSFDDKLKQVHETYCENGKAYDGPDRTKIEVARMGVLAYAQAASKHPSDAAGHIYKFLSERRVRAHQSSMTPLLVTGNLLAAQHNKKRGVEKIAMPGLGNDGLLPSFKIIRAECAKISRPEAKLQTIQKLGDIVEHYIAKTFEDFDAIEYRLPEAGEDVLTRNVFLNKIDISSSDLDYIMKEHGITFDTYGFPAGFISPGVTPENRAKLLPLIEEYKRTLETDAISVHHFTIISPLGSQAMERIIKDNDIEVGEAQFGTKIGRSLTLEARNKILEIWKAEQATRQAERRAKDEEYRAKLQAKAAAAEARTNARIAKAKEKRPAAKKAPAKKKAPKQGPKAKEVTEIGEGFAKEIVELIESSGLQDTVLLDSSAAKKDETTTSED